MPQSPERKREYMRAYMAKRREEGLTDLSVSPARHEAVSPSIHATVFPNKLPKAMQREQKRHTVDPEIQRALDAIHAHIDWLAEQQLAFQQEMDRRVSAIEQGIRLQGRIITEGMPTWSTDRSGATEPR